MTAGRVQTRYCKHCGIRYTKYTWSPSTLILIIVVVISTLITRPILIEKWGAGWGLILIQVVFHFMAFPLFHGLLSGIVNNLNPLPDVCPDCGRRMEISGGFADRSGPGMMDFVGGIIYIVIIFIVRLV